MANNDGWNWVALAADVGTLALPVVAGGGMAVRSLKVADKVGDVGKIKNVIKVSDRTINLPYKQLEKKFEKHAKAFGIEGTPSPENIKMFGRAIEDFIKSDSTIAIKGTYRNTIKGTHYYDPKTKDNNSEQ